MSSLFIFMAALFTSLALVPVLRRWALTTGTVDTPDERKVHKKAIPRLGGVAVYLCFLFASLVFIDASREVRGILAGGLVVFITGLIDDLYGLSPKKKFVGEIAAVVVTMLVSHLYLENLGDLFGFGPVVLVPWLAVPFTIFAVVGVINAINLIDGLDGLSGGISVIALAAFMVLSFHDGNKEVLALSAALLGSVIGFLKYNLYPARIFMGDAGSLSVGFVLGFLAVFLTQSPLSSVSPMTPVVILGLPIIDAIWVMVRRVMKGNKPFTPDMTHLHHKFLNLGFQHRFTVIVIYGISLFWVLVAITVREWPEYLLLLSYVVVSMLFYGLLRYFIDHREKYTFFAKDSSEGLRESYTYRMLAAKADYAKPLLFALLIGYFSLTIIVGISEDVSSIKMGLFYVPGLVIVGSFRNRLRTSVVKAFFYLSALVAAFIINQASNIDLWFGVDLAQIEILIFVLILTLVVIKSVFRLEGELYVSLPEIVVLAAGVFALVAFSQITELSHLSNVPIRGGVLFLAINLVFFYRGRSVE